MIIRIDDVRKAGYCVRGIREWATLNGFDFADFLRNGIDAAQLEAANDAMASRVIRLKIEREQTQ